MQASIIYQFERDVVWAWGLHSRHLVHSWLEVLKSMTHIHSWWRRGFGNLLGIPQLCLCFCIERWVKCSFQNYFMSFESARMFVLSVIIQELLRSSMEISETTYISIALNIDCLLLPAWFAFFLILFWYAFLSLCKCFLACIFDRVPEPAEDFFLSQWCCWLQIVFIKPVVILNLSEADDRQCLLFLWLYHKWFFSHPHQIGRWLD